MSYNKLQSHAIYQHAKNIVLVCNHTAFDFDQKKYLFELIQQDQKLYKIFTLEHGLFSDAQDQVCINDTSFQEIPCISLYHKNIKDDFISTDIYADVDAIVMDIANVGARYYTFIAHKFRILETTPSDIPILLINRQNLIGNTVEGTILPAYLASILGVAGLIHRHGMNTYQLCQWYVKTNDNERNWPTIIPIQITESKNSTLIAPSPNLPTSSSLSCYPGQCLWEATTWSEGRGTTQPFELFGHPTLDWTNAQTIAKKFNKRFHFKAHIRVTTFTPTFHKHANQSCIGWQLMILDHLQYPVVFGTIYLMRLCFEHMKDIPFWRMGSYEYDTSLTAADALIGDEELVKYIEGKISEQHVLEKMAIDRQKWIDIRSIYCSD